MAYNQDIADRLREYLVANTDLPIEEKRMFGGLAFMVDGKMCVNVKDDRLMCRIGPDHPVSITDRPGYEAVSMNGKAFKDFCFVHSEGFEKEVDFHFWVDQCLAFNPLAKSSKKKK